MDGKYQNKIIAGASKTIQEQLEVAASLANYTSDDRRVVFAGKNILYAHIMFDVLSNMICLNVY